MPANLPPQYFEAEKRLRMAKTPEEKIEALETMLAIMPKHKGTDKLHAELRRKIAKFTEEAERRYATSRTSFHIRKEGAGQVALVGLPNTGKSQLLASLTEATPEIGDYPFTTQRPTVGMIKFQNIQIQMIDMPPVTGKESRVWINNIARNADLVAITVDMGYEPVQQVEAVLQELESMGIIPETDVSDESTIGRRQRKMMVIANKSDADDSGTNQQQLSSRYDTRFPLVSVSAAFGIGLEELKKKIFDALEIMRVYTKTPGTKPDMNDPIILKRGSTIKNAAEDVHKDFKAKLKYAVVWGSGKFDGQRVGPEHVLKDGDIIELHI
ncbi:MAG: TGS domain-containing protein [Chloroflexi bacterium]|nr:TGS domain-containing protein [Chloroflexota bacterium]MBM3183208.1 TGS domain-containing protein [Chloroflexota bacterium]MBM4454521.1 TGS domain-containing protein [Chloroflexota bacterium]